MVSSLLGLLGDVQVEQHPTLFISSTREGPTDFGLEVFGVPRGLDSGLTVKFQKSESQKVRRILTKLVISPG